MFKHMFKSYQVLPTNRHVQQGRNHGGAVPRRAAESGQRKSRRRRQKLPP